MGESSAPRKIAALKTKDDLVAQGPVEVQPGKKHRRERDVDTFAKGRQL